MVKTRRIYLSVVLCHMLLHAKFFFQIIVVSFEYPHFPLFVKINIVFFFNILFNMLKFMNKFWKHESYTFYIILSHITYPLRLKFEFLDNYSLQVCQPFWKELYVQFSNLFFPFVKYNMQVWLCTGWLPLFCLDIITLRLK